MMGCGQRISGCSRSRNLGMQLFDCLGSLALSQLLQEKPAKQRM
jgi:hypothetical protein